jgi:predicted permease
MGNLLQDIRYSIRRLTRDPGTTAMALLALSVAIGANAVIFGVVEGVLLRPLPFPAAERLFLVTEDNPAAGKEEMQVSIPTFLDWRQRSHGFENLAAAAPAIVTLRGGGEPEAVKTALVSTNFFSTLGVKPILGRDFLAEEDDLHRPAPVVLLGHEIWQSSFGGDPSVLGHRVWLGDNAVTVIGVMPAGIKTPGGTKIWVPLSLTPALFPTAPGILEERSGRLLHVFGRVGPGGDASEARRDLDAVEQQLAGEYPDVYREMRTSLVPLRERAVRKIKTSLLFLQLAVGLVLLMVVANLSSLSLARGLEREKEIAIRIALGVNRRQLFRQFLTESVLLSLLGAAGGLLLASWGIGLVLRMAPQELPYADRISLDGGVFAMTLAVAALAGLLSGLLPAWRVSAPAGEGGERSDARRPDPVRGSRLQSWLVGLEAGLAVLLLVVTGLLVRSFLRIHEIDPGFQPRDVLTITLSLPADRYPDPEATASFYRQVLERVRTLPGVVSASVATDAPLQGTSGLATLAPPGQGKDRALEVGCEAVSPGYFATLGVPLLQGRDFQDSDVRPGPRILVVNRSLAEQLWPGENPVGKALVRDGSQEIQIVGMVGDVRQDGLTEEAPPLAYEPAFWNNATLFLRTEGDPEALARPARRQILAVDSRQVPYETETLESILAKTTAQARFNVLLFGAFGAVALVLGAGGIFGILSIFAARRQREIGIRMAMGASRGHVVRLVIGRGMRLAAGGIAAALLAASWLTRWMAGMLFEVSPGDPSSFLGAGLLMAAVALLSCLLPAWRASKLDPVALFRVQN